MAAIPYEPAIDGLRAVAVLAVCVYHLNPALLPGGFTGVDVFFVISGFLITRIITSEIDKGTFSFAAFYRRRIARIAPALVVVAWATLLGACVLYAPQDKAAAGANFIAALLSFANIKLMLQGSYFEMSPDAQPFLHFWSLSVEEQFYLLFPVLLALLYRTSKSAAFVAGVVVAAASFALCMWLTPIRQPWAFYLLPTRAWELLCGALVSPAVKVGQGASSRKMAMPLCLAGVIGIVVSMLMLREDARFPGYFAAVPVLATTAILWSIDRIESGTFAMDLLRHAALVAIGKLSYSIYLWHWPIFSFVDYSLFAWPATPRLLLKVAASALLAVGSYFAIEAPARAFLSRSHKASASFAALAVAVLVGVWFGLQVRRENYLDASARDIARGGVVENAQATKGTIALIGDSTGSMYATTLRDACRSSGYRLVVLSTAGGWPFPNQPNDDRKEWLDVLSAIQKSNPQIIVIACRWESMLRRSPELAAFVVGSLKQPGRRIVLVNSVPYLPSNASREGIRAGYRQPFFEPADKKAERETANNLIERLTSDSVILLDAAKVCLNEEQIVVFDNQGRCRYHDAGHLSGYGASDLFEGFASLLVNSSALKGSSN